VLEQWNVEVMEKYPMLHQSGTLLPLLILGNIVDFTIDACRFRLP